MGDPGTPGATGPADHGRAGGTVQQTRALARRVPFSLSVVAVMLLLGLLTGTLWNGLHERALSTLSRTACRPSSPAGSGPWSPVRCSPSSRLSTSQ